MLIVSTSSFLSGQEIDQSFLDSLPEDIRKDVLERIENTDDREQDVYRSLQASSVIYKDEDEDDENFEDLEIFGESFFDSVQTSFMPINAPNFDDSYILDFGDVLEIQLVGQNDSIDSYLIARDGSINISDIGKIYVSGLSLGNASALILQKVEKAYIGTRAYITLINVRDVNVLISGDAYNPGVYTLNGNSDILHAITVAGGISEYGSYRDIRLVRDNKIVSKLDLYDILINGQYSSRERLRTGDIIFIGPKKHHVAVDGAFNRPAIYELLEDQNLGDAINYANGINNISDLSNISLYRILDGKIESLPIASLSQFNKIKSYDGDRIFVRKHSFRSVKIAGSVLKPGNYLMTEGDTITDLIEKAGGLTENAYPFGAVYINKEAQVIGEKASEVLYQEFIDNMIGIMESSPSGEVNFASLINMVQDIRNEKPQGRIVVDIIDDSGTNPVYVQNEDYLFIPEKNNNVFVFGEVSKDGSVLYKNSENIEYYLNQSGGIKDSADRKSIYVLYPNGNSERVFLNKNIFARQSLDIKIYPGSVIFVPRKIDNQVAARLTAQAYASILGNIGVSLASLSVLND